MKQGIGRTLRAAFGNAVVWGIGWTGLGLASMFAMRAIGVVVPAEIRAIDILGMAIRIGVFGAITGTAFSLFIRTFYRGRRLEDLNALRFGLVGGVAAAVFGPLFMQSMNLLSGDGLVPWSDINGDVVMLGVFGGLAAGASLKLAQVANRFVPSDAPASIDEAEGVPQLESTRGVDGIERAAHLRDGERLSGR